RAAPGALRRCNTSRGAAHTARRQGPDTRPRLRSRPARTPGTRARARARRRRARPEAGAAARPRPPARAPGRARRRGGRPPPPRPVREALELAGTNRTGRRDHRLGLIRLGRHLRRLEPAVVEEHGVRERPADVDAQDRHGRELIRGSEGRGAAAGAFSVTWAVT